MHCLHYCQHLRRIPREVFPKLVTAKIMAANIIQLRSGGEKLLLDGETFYHRLRSGNKRYWKCAVKSCSATAVTLDAQGARVQLLKDTRHSHPVSFDHETDLSQEIDTEDEDFQMEDGDEETEADEDEPRSDQDEEMDSDGVENSEDDTDVIDSQNDVSWQEWVETGSDEENCDESDDVSLDEYSENYDDESDVEMNSDSDETDFEDNENNESDTEFDSFELKCEHEKSYKEKIRYLRNSEVYLRAAVLENSDKGLICFLNEICLNLKSGYFTINSKFERNIMKLYEEKIGLMANEHVTWQTKKQYLIENAQDTFLPVLLNYLAESHHFCR